MATYAGRYDEPLLKRVGGRLVPATSATVTVYESDGETEATVYTDRTKSTEADNPVSPDASGNLEFFADPGTYVLSIAEGGTVQATDTVAVPVDLGDIPAEAILSITSATKAADETVTNSTTLQDDNHLSLTLGVGTFVVEGLLIFSSAVAAGISFGWSGTMDGTFDWHITGEDDAALAGAGVGTERSASFRGTAVVSTAGTLALQWAQTTADATNTVLHAGSHMIATEV